MRTCEHCYKRPDYTCGNLEVLCDEFIDIEVWRQCSDCHWMIYPGDEPNQDSGGKHSCKWRGVLMSAINRGECKDLKSIILAKSW